MRCEETKRAIWAARSGQGCSPEQMKVLEDVYSEVNKAANIVFQRLSESGVQNSTAPDTDELELGESVYSCINGPQFRFDASLFLKLFFLEMQFTHSSIQ